MRFVMKNGGDEQILTNNKKVPNNAWHHIAITLKPKGDKVHAILYYDGENVAESSDFTILPSDIAPSLCYIGRSMFTADPMFNGRIDDFRIYNYALTADQVAAIMTDLDPISQDITDDYEETIPTAIKDIEEERLKNEKSAGAVYDLNGRPATPSDKGILIQNKKKVLVK